MQSVGADSIGGPLRLLERIGNDGGPGEESPRRRRARLRRTQHASRALRPTASAPEYRQPGAVSRVFREPLRRAVRLHISTGRRGPAQSPASTSAGTIPRRSHSELLDEALRSTQHLAAQVEGSNARSKLPLIDTALALGRLTGLTGKDEIVWLRACLEACSLRRGKDRGPSPDLSTAQINARRSPGSGTDRRSYRGSSGS